VDVRPVFRPTDTFTVFKVLHDPFLSRNGKDGNCKWSHDFYCLYCLFLPETPFRVPKVGP
jgi:hypothetical protein